jgi:hypothetical protein
MEASMINAGIQGINCSKARINSEHLEAVTVAQVKEI